MLFVGFEKSEWIDWYCLTNAAEFGIPEGTASDWRQLLSAVRRTGSFESRRLACRRIAGGWEICSPRNRFGTADFYWLRDAEADEFCRMVEDEINKHDPALLGGAGI